MGEQQRQGTAFGIVSVCLGAVTFGIQIMGGLCCGWIGWPLGIAAIICGIVAIVQGAKGLGALGIVLSVVGVVLQVVGATAGTAALSGILQESVNR